jgi:ornithine cyclodeaminase
MFIINAEETYRLLTMEACIDVMEPAMKATSSGSTLIPPRTLFQLQDDSGFFAVMPGASSEMGVYGAKMVSYHPENSARGEAPLQGFVAMFDHDNGRPLAIIDGGAITNIRTAAASGLATRLLARHDADSCGIFGAGALADTHIAAMCAVRPVRECVIWARRQEQASALAEKHSAGSPVRFRATSDPEEAAACDLICTTTASTRPVIRGEWVRPGTHINLVGAHRLDSREADTDLIVKSVVYVDSMESTRNEGGDVMIPIEEGAIDEDHICGEIGVLLDGGIPGRQHDGQITVYNSLGITSQDLYAAEYVLRQALKQGDGTQVSF